MRQHEQAVADCQHLPSEFIALIALAVIDAPGTTKITVLHPNTHILVVPLQRGIWLMHPVSLKQKLRVCLQVSHRR